MRCDSRARLEIGFPSPVDPSRSFLTKRSAALPSITFHCTNRWVRSPHHETDHCGCPDCRRVPCERRRAAADGVLEPAAERRVARADQGRQRRRPPGAAGGRAARCGSSTLNSATQARGVVDASARTRAQRPQGREGRVDRGLHRRVQLGREQDLDPDPQPRRHPADQPVEHLQRAHDARCRHTSGEPGKYYPTGVRTYFRIAPERPRAGRRARHRDARPRLHRRSRFVHDGEVYGKGMNTDVVATAARLGLPVVANRRISRSAPSAIRRAKADCMAYTGITANGAVRLFRSSALRGACSSSAATAWPRRASSGRLPRSGRPPHDRHRRDAPDAGPVRQPRPVLRLRLRGDEADPRRSRRVRRHPRRPARLAADRPEPPERARHVRLRRQRRHHAAHLRALRRHPQAASSPTTARSPPAEQQQRRRARARRPSRRPGAAARPRRAAGPRRTPARPRA